MGIGTFGGGKGWTLWNGRDECLGVGFREGRGVGGLGSGGWGGCWGFRDGGVSGEVGILVGDGGLVGGSCVIVILL